MTKYQEIKDRNSEVLRQDVAEGRTVFEGLPEIVNFNSTSVCNLRCIMCFQAYHPGKDTMPMDRARSVLDQLLPTARKLRLTTAGEPIAGPFRELVDITRKYECKLDITTNATGLTPARLQYMEDLLDHLAISLDSHLEDVLDHIRGKGVHERIMKNLRDVNGYLVGRERPYITSFNLVLMTSNAPHLAGFVEFARDAGIDHIRVLRMSYMTQELKDNEDPFVCYPKEELDQYVAEAQKAAREYDVNLILDETGYESVRSHEERSVLPPPLDSPYCNMMVQEVFIRPDETVYPCCIPGDLRMGTLKKKPFAEIWNGPKYKRLRKQMFDQRLIGPCATCKHYTGYKDERAYDYRPGSRTLKGFQRFAAPAWVKKLRQR